MSRIFILIFLSGFICIPGISQTATLHPVKDNTIFSENGAISNGAGTEFYVGQTGPNAGFANRRSLLQFDLASIPAGSLISAVSLSVTCTRVPPMGSKTVDLVNLHKCLTPWGEGSSASGGAGSPASADDATWTCSFADGTGGCTQAWTKAGGDFSSVVSSNVTVDDAGVYTFSSSPKLVADLQSWVDNPAANFGWLLSGNEARGFSVRGFGSREDNVAPPSLTVTYSAPPCTWTGAISSAWETAGNWSCGTVPDSNADVIINNGTVVLNSSVVIRSLTLSAGVNFTVKAGLNFTVTH